MDFYKPEITVYMFEDGSANDYGYVTQDVEEARKHAREYNLRILAVTYTEGESTVFEDYAPKNEEPVAAKYAVGAQLRYVRQDQSGPTDPSAIEPANGAVITITAVIDVPDDDHDRDELPAYEGIDEDGNEWELGEYELAPLDPSA